jgi:signal transduction histidine kinase
LSVNAQLDSLINVINHEIDPLKRLPAYGAYAFRLYRTNPDSSIRISQQGIKLADSLQNVFHKASCFNMLGLAYHRKGWYSSAIKAYEQSIQSFNQVKEIEQMARVYLNLSNVFQTKKDYRSAQEFNLKALKQFELLKDSSRIATCYVNLANVNRELKEYEKAKEYIQTSIEILSHLNNIGELGISYSSKGNLFLTQNLLPEAKVAFIQSSSYLQKAGDDGNLAIVLENLGETYMRLADYEKSIETYQLSLDIFERLGSEVDIAYEKMRMSISVAYLKRFPEAMALLDQAEIVFRGENLPEYLYELYGFKSDILGMQNKHEEALFMYRKAIQLKDSLSSAQRSDELIRLQAEFETDKKEQQIQLLESQSKIKDTELKQRNSLIVTLLVIGALGVFLVLMFQKRSKLKEALEKQKILNRIASDLHDDVGASLSSIRMYGDMLKQKAKKNAPELIPFAEKVSENAREMIYTMSDIVWTIKPGQEKLSALQDRIWNMGLELCAPKEIHFIFKGHQKASEIAPSAELRHALLMVSKEAINNAVKYAECTEITLDLSLNESNILIKIADNGKGFDPENAKGNGLRNMKSRAMEHHGTFKLQTNSLHGTQLEFAFPLN